MSMIRGGFKRAKVDKRDWSFHRSFGTVAVPLELKEYSYDVGLTMPDQNADGYPYGCTGYTAADIAGDEDKAVYRSDYVYKKASFMEGHEPDQGVDVRTAAKAGKLYGMKKSGQSDDPPYENLRGAFYNVDKVPGYDWFDSFRSALRTGGLPISTGTIWFPEWRMTGQDGVLTSLFVWDGKWDSESGHNYKMCGEKTIDGQPYLIVKSWQGRNVGDNGWLYMGRETFNKAFDIYGTIGLTQSKAAPKDIYTIKLDLLQWILVYLGRWLGLIANA